MREYKRAVLKTLSYSNVFKYPLTREQLFKFLIWETKVKVKYSKFSKAIEELISQKKIYQIKSYYLLENKKNYIHNFLKEKKEAIRKINIARKTAYLLSFIPTIEFIGLSGKLSLGVATKEDDIDLFIIAKKHTLWITRLLVLLFLAFVGIKRNPDKKVTKNTICANMFIDTSRLKIPTNEQDLFSSHEIVQLVPIINKNNTYEQFLKENQWVKKYLPNSVNNFENINKRNDNLFKIFSFIENFAYNLQLSYMKKRITSEKVTKSYVRFHPNDARNWILNSYNKNIKTII